jgi:hypothetical protein
MGDRAHPGRQGDLRKLEERDETFPGSPAHDNQNRLITRHLPKFSAEMSIL